MKLWEIKGALASYEPEFDAETGEWLNEKELTDLEMARDAKIEGMCHIVQNLQAELDAVKGTKKNFDTREKTLTNKIKRLKERIAYELDGEKFKTPEVEVRYTKSTSVEIVDENLVPDEFKRFKAISEPNKDEIKKYLKSLAKLKEEGETVEDVPWAYLEERRNIRII